MLDRPPSLTRSKLHHVYQRGVNAISPIDEELPRAAFEVAREAASAWRGRCLDLFSRSEAAVTETLLVLAAIEGRGTAIKLPHLVGQRYDALVAAIGPEGAFAEEGKAAAGAVACFQKHDALRTHLAHGTFTVTLDHRGRWHLVSRVITLRTGREARDLFVTEEVEAAETLSSLDKDGGRLRSTLGQLRQRARTT
jgi:hypothetical protein